MRWVASVVAGAACLWLGAAVVEAEGSSAETGRATIRVTARQATSAGVDIGRAGRSPGDLQITSARIYNTRVTPRPIGEYELVCTYVRSISRLCRGSIQMPRGQIAVSGTMRYRPLYQLAVVGGTGLYDNARGTVTVTRLGTKPVRDLVVVRLVG